MDKFLKLADDTDPELIYDMMLDHWGMEKPRILISVTGGAKSFNLLLSSLCMGYFRAVF